MLLRLRRLAPVGAALALIAPLTAVGQQAPKPQAPTVIRSQITLVPVDVRVVDRDGRPITDLTEADFTVFEDGVPHAIRHFSAHAFTADPHAVSAQPQFRTPQEEGARASNRRVFLIMLGRGQHQSVSKYVEALHAFITKGLLPQDQVAIMAWNRATDFTSDHAKAGRILERFRDQHGQIEHELLQWFTGLRALYGSPDIPAHIQRKIDAVYEDAGDLRPRSLTPSPSSDAAARSEMSRRAAEEIQRDEIMKTFPGSGFITDSRAEILASLSGMTFEDYVARSSETLQDLGSLYAAVDYLRYLEGEKHLLFLTEKGIDIPLTEGNRNWRPSPATRASPSTSCRRAASPASRRRASCWGRRGRRS
ncbi:MAG: hypothetical protein M3R55_16875 [Acidobacteriota bacterium]|nr:hypothetical protein [Acidobacteriota bacterium]